MVDIHFAYADVSIHAPARGATTRRRLFVSRSKCFNPRAREGRDNFAVYVPAAHLGFNPRAREGRDLLWGIVSGTCACFNPRAREGRDTPSLTVAPF